MVPSFVTVLYASATTPEPPEIDAPAVFKTLLWTAPLG
jgi:hypothetical protein